MDHQGGLVSAVVGKRNHVNEKQVSQRKKVKRVNVNRGYTGKQVLSAVLGIKTQR